MAHSPTLPSPLQYRLAVVHLQFFHHICCILQPHEELGNYRFDFQIRKRQQQQPVHNNNALPFRKGGQADLFDPRTGTQLFSKPLPPNTNDHGTSYMSSELFNMFPSLKMNYDSDGQKGNSKTVVTSLENMHEANQLLNDLSQGIGKVADSPPVQTFANIKADSIEYPEYEIWDDDFTNIYNTENTIRKSHNGALTPPEKMNLYQYGPSYQVCTRHCYFSPKEPFYSAQPNISRIKC